MFHQHGREKPIGKRRLRVPHLEHVGVFDNDHGARAQRRARSVRLWVCLVGAHGHRLGRIATAQDQEDRRHEAKAENHNRGANGCHVACQAEEACGQNQRSRDRVRLLTLHEWYCAPHPGKTLFGNAHTATRSAVLHRTARFTTTSHTTAMIRRRP